MPVTFIQSGRFDSVSYDADAQAYFARLGTQPDATRKGHINTFIAGLKTDGLWTRFDVLWCPAAVDVETDALLNLKSSSFTLTRVNSPTFTASRGFAGNGSTSYLDTGWDGGTNGSQFSQNSAHAAVYVNATASDVEDSNRLVFGGLAGVGGTTVGTWRTGGSLGNRINNSTNTSYGSTISTRLGLTTLVRTGSTATEAYRNSTSIGTGTPTSGSPATMDFTIGGVNGGTTSPTDERVAFASLGASFNSTQMSNLYSRLNTFLTAIGAN